MTTGRCCYLCKSPYGCGASRKCDCHAAETTAEVQADIDHQARRTYTDRTADIAIARADRARRAK